LFNVEYHINALSDISIDISDLLGRKILTQINTEQSPGLHQERLNLYRDNNKPIADGIYIVQLRFTNDSKMDLATDKIQIVR